MKSLWWPRTSHIQWSTQYCQSPQIMPCLTLSKPVMRRMPSAYESPPHPWADGQNRMGYGMWTTISWYLVLVTSARCFSNLPMTILGISALISHMPLSVMLTTGRTCIVTWSRPTYLHAQTAYETNHVRPRCLSFTPAAHPRWSWKRYWDGFHWSFTTRQRTWLHTVNHRPSWSRCMHHTN